jgi:hypothetical protein
MPPQASNRCVRDYELPASLRQGFGLKNVAAHVHGCRTTAVGALEAIVSTSISGSFFPLAITIGTGQEAVTVSKPSARS